MYISVQYRFNDLFCATFSSLSILCLLIANDNAQKNIQSNSNRHQVLVYNILAVFFISLGISIKMSVLFFIPAFLLITTLNQGLLTAIFYQIMILLLCLFYSLPFLMHNAKSYYSVAFDFDRTFDLIVSRNYHFLTDEEFYKSNSFSKVLLALHLILLLVALLLKWLSLKGVFSTLGLYPLRLGIFGFQVDSFKPLTSIFIAEVFFVCNIIGIFWLRGMHQQFSIWYSFSIPFLICKNYSEMNLATLAVFWAFFILYQISVMDDPSTWKSLYVQFTHLILLILALGKYNMESKNEKVKKE